MPQKSWKVRPRVSPLWALRSTQTLCILHFPEDKLARLNHDLLRWSKRRSCRRRQLESLIGLLQHACWVVRPGRSFVRRMIALPIGLTIASASTDTLGRTSYGGVHSPHRGMEPVSSHQPPLFTRVLRQMRQAPGAVGCAATTGGSNSSGLQRLENTISLAWNFWQCSWLALLGPEDGGVTGSYVGATTRQQFRPSQHSHAVTAVSCISSAACFSSRHLFSFISQPEIFLVATTHVPMTNHLAAFLSKVPDAN